MSGATKRQGESPAAKTNAQRQAGLKARRVAAGLVQVTNCWAHPADLTAIKAFAKLLRIKRVKERYNGAP